MEYHRERAHFVEPNVIEFSVGLRLKGLESLPFRQIIAPSCSMRLDFGTRRCPSALSELIGSPTVTLFFQSVLFGVWHRSVKQSRDWYVNISTPSVHRPMQHHGPTGDPKGHPLSQT
jgi:hypothetical protein